MADFLRGRNPNVEIYLMATWSRADQTYPATGAWAGQADRDDGARRARGLRQGGCRRTGVKTVIPVGEAWTRAIQTGVADPNPYDGIEAGKLNLWTYDHYHASAHGYYLEALVIFGALTGRDPRSLGDNECSALRAGLRPAAGQSAPAGRVRPALRPAGCRTESLDGGDAAPAVPVGPVAPRAVKSPRPHQGEQRPS